MINVKPSFPMLRIPRSSFTLSCFLLEGKKKARKRTHQHKPIPMQRERGGREKAAAAGVSQVNFESFSSSSLNKIHISRGRTWELAGLENWKQKGGEYLSLGNMNYSEDPSRTFGVSCALKITFIYE